MYLEEEPVQCQFSVYDTGLFTAEEIQEVYSILQTEPKPVSPKSGSEVTTRFNYSLEEKKKRRMMSNRESARRSRLKKKKQLENLTDQGNRLSVENRALKNRLGLMMNQYYLMERENELLRTESLALWTTLANLYQNIVAMQMQMQMPPQ
ncbi:hypothetical protein ACFE04_004738 [Oxalis oulophora]